MEWGASYVMGRRSACAGDEAGLLPRLKSRRPADPSHMANLVVAVCVSDDALRASAVPCPALTLPPL